MGVDKVSIEGIGKGINPKLIEYPRVIVDPFSPYCDCKEKEYQNYGATAIGPHYCPKHNVIILEGIYSQQEIEEISFLAVEILIHETMHWILGKIFGEPVSYDFDNEKICEFIENNSDV